MARHQRNLTRRKMLFTLGGAAVGIPAIAAIAPHALAGQSDGAATKAAGSLPVTVVNNSGSFTNGSVHLYVVGNAGGKQVRLTPDGTLAPIALSDNGADGFTDYAIPLSGSGETKLNLPYMSGRIYVSLGAKLKFKAVTDGAGNAALQYPAGWVKSDPNYGVLHDCAEFTFNEAGMFCNTTMVDMFSIPMSIRLTGERDQTTGTVREGGRADAFAALRRVEEFAPLVVDDTRIIAPGHGLDAGLFAEDYFAPYIDEVWSTYTGKDLTVTTNAGTFTGRVRGERFTFDGPAQVSFAKPSTRDVLFCDGNLAAPQRRHHRTRRGGPRRRVQPVDADQPPRAAHHRRGRLLPGRADQPLRARGARGHGGRQGVRVRVRRRGGLRVVHPGHRADRLHPHPDGVLTLLRSAPL
ncbi:glycoside hydrolase family 64 protein [Streptomyces thermocoprophilus]